MARPRSFDTDAVLDAAMMTFWRHGYEATTTRMLEEATGVGLRSLFNAFGDKEALFQQVLDRYFAMVEDNLTQVFAEPGLPAISMVFEGFLVDEPPDSIRNAGCLMVNTVFELDRLGPDVKERVETYRQLWHEAFRDSLTADGIDAPDERAEFLVGTLWGALSKIRLSGSLSAAAPIARITLDTLRGWRGDHTKV